MKKFLLFLIPALLLAETVISPNMNLPVPVVGTTPGPTWATNINSCLGAIDSHDHTPGKGVPISSQAININANLPLNGNALTSVKDVQFSSQASLSSTQAIYVIAPDLFYNDANGNVVRITQNGSVSGATGTITGLPSGTASASYQSVGGTFVFQSATNTPANGSFASLTIAQQTVTPNGITLKSPNSLAASYNVTFPASLPSFTSLLTMDTSGTLSTVAYHAPTVQKFVTPLGIQTYTLPTNPTPLYIRVVLAGAGGGGGAAQSNPGFDGGATTFGTSLLTGSGGKAGSASNNGGGRGGTASLGNASGVNVAGGGGGSGSSTSGAAGGMGGANAFGGAGSAPLGSGSDGSAGAANTGAGGGGGFASNVAGGGGGAGGYVDAIITSPSSTYSYAVGAGGAGGAAGSQNGGAGGSGVVIVYEFYQ